jgi:replicative DNA helicase
MLAENAAIHVPGAVVGVFSLEMSKEALVMRMLCSQGNIDAQRFRNGFLSRPEWAQIAQVARHAGRREDLPRRHCRHHVLEMRAKARRLAAEQKRLDLIVVDYLQLMSGRRSASSRGSRKCRRFRVS